MASDGSPRKEFRVEDVKYLVEDTQVERGSFVLSSPHGHRGVSSEEKELVRKLDLRIVPIISIVYLFACKSNQAFSITHLAIVFFADLDRSNLGNARLQGFPEDVLEGDPTGNLFDWTNTAFFIAYVCYAHNSRAPSY